MSFANPWALLAGFAAVPVVVAYLSRRRDRRRVVSSAILFRVIGTDEVASRRALSRPQHLWSLLLVMLALIAMVVGIAGPRLGTRDTNQYIFVVDRSASMGMLTSLRRDGGADATRLAQAVRELASMVYGMSPEDQVALVTAGDRGEISAGASRNHTGILQLARALRAGGGGGGLPEALQLADAMCRDPEQTLLVVFTDDAGALGAETRCPVQIVLVGAAAENLGVTSLAYRRADSLGLSEVYVAVNSTFPEARTVEVVLSLDSVVLEVVSLELPAAGSSARLIRLPMPDGRLLSAEVADIQDALAQDDVAYVVIREVPAVKVQLLTSRADSFVARALSLHPRVQLTVQTEPAAGTAVSAQSERPEFDLVIVEGDYRGEVPPAPRLLVLGAAPERFGVTAKAAVTAVDRSIIRWDFGATLLRFVDLSGVHLESGRVLEVPAGGRSLIDAVAGPVAVVAHRDGRELAVFGFTVEQSDVALRVAFPNLIANAIDWAAPPTSGVRTDLQQAALKRNVLSSVETRGAVVGIRASSAVTTPMDDSPWSLPLPLWRLVVLAAVALLMCEWLLPLAVRGRKL